VRRDPLAGIWRACLLVMEGQRRSFFFFFHGVWLLPTSFLGSRPDSGADVAFSHSLSPDDDARERRAREFRTLATSWRSDRPLLFENLVRVSPELMCMKEYLEPVLVPQQGFCCDVLQQLKRSGAMPSTDSLDIFAERGETEEAGRCFGERTSMMAALLQAVEEAIVEVETEIPEVVL
jgi:hypothetical protein